MPLPDSYAALVTQAEQFLRQDRLADALDVYLRVAQRLAKLSDESLKKRPDLHQLSRQAGFQALSLARRLGQFDTAFQIIDIIDKPDFEFKDSLVLLRAQTLADAGRLEEALSLLRQASQRDDLPVEARLNMAREALWHQQAHLALDILQPLTRETVDSDQKGLWQSVLFLRFRSWAMLGRVDEAEIHWQALGESIRGTDLQMPDNSWITEMFLKRGDFSKALDYAEKERHYAVRGFLRGLVAKLMGKHEWATDEWWRVTREAFDVEDRGFPEWLECALRLSDMEKASAAIDAGLERFSRSPRMLLFHAVRLLKTGEREDGLELLRSLAELNQQAKVQRQLFIIERDRWLIEHSLADEQLRAAALETLFRPVEDAKPSSEFTIDSDDAGAPAHQPEQD